MKIVGCDFHPRWQQIAVFDTETGEISERKLLNGDGGTERFYRRLAGMQEYLYTNMPSGLP